MNEIVRPLLHQTDPYTDFVAHDCDLRGWNNHTEHFNNLLGAGSRLVIEIGSWLGNSAIHLANAAPNAEIVCVDTWLGAREMWENHGDPERYQSLKLRNGYPSLYYDFLSNIVRAGKQEQATPMPMSSGVAFEFLQRNLLTQPDLIYIDGSHSYNDVWQDVTAALRLNPRVLCGDDFCDWQDVRLAVVDVLGEDNLEVLAGGFWVWRSK